jgi:outer membrane protein assembly factor BamB
MLEADLLKCANCDAPLSPVPGENLVTCAYCGAVSNLTQMEANVGAAMPRTVGSPPNSPPASAKRGWIVAVVVVVVVGTFSSLVAFLPSLLGTSWVGLVQEWYSAACLVDANGDGVLDVAGLGATPGSEIWRLQLVDGATGTRLWSGGTYSPYAKLVCLSPQYFGIDNVDFQLRLFPARSPDSPVNVALHDHIERAGLGTNCITVKQTNGETLSISLAGGRDRCDAANLLENQGFGAQVSSISHVMEIVTGDSSYTLTEHEPGTPFLIVTKFISGHQKWTQQLAYVPTDSGFRAVATLNALVVWGGMPSDDKYAAIIGLDPETGAQRYAIKQSSDWSGRVLRDISFNGRYVIVSWGFGLHAYDPSTGERVWHIGGR